MEDSHFNIDQLGLDTVELLVLLMEECGEVVQAASKCMRDKNYINDKSGFTHMEELKIEMNDLRIIIGEVNKKLCTTPEQVLHMSDAKWNKLKKWTNVFKNGRLKQND